MLEYGAASLPVQFGRDGVPYFWGEIDKVGDERFGYVRNLPHLGMQTQLYHHRGMPARFLRYPVMQFLTNRSLALELRLHGITCHDDVLEEKQLLAIGPGSDMSRTFSTISFVHNNNGTGSLLLGISEIEFVTSYCYSDSIIRLRTDEYREFPSYSYTMGKIPSWSEESLEMRFTASDKLLLIPTQIFSGFFHQFPEIVNGGIIFGNCSENRNLLPEIRLAFEQEDGHMIILRPEDYTRFRNDYQNSPIDECDFLIGQTPWGMHVEMNPLLIPSINSFAANHTLVLCKALQHRE